jgi:hypothetical protein
VSFNRGAEVTRLCNLRGSSTRGQGSIRNCMGGQVGAVECVCGVRDGSVGDNFAFLRRRFRDTVEA